MPTSIVTTAGITAAENAGTAGAQIMITSFQIGNILATPHFSSTSVVSPVYTGDASQMTYAVIAQNQTMSFTIILNETVGNFNIGTIGLFLADGTLFSLTELDSLESKVASNVTATPPIQGNAKAYSILIRIANVNSLINVTNMVANYASLPSVTTQATLPPVNSAFYNAYLVEDYTQTGISSVAINNGTNWIQCLGLQGTSNSAFLIPNIFNRYPSNYGSTDPNSPLPEGTALAWNGTNLVYWNTNDLSEIFIGILGTGGLIYRSGIFTYLNSNPGFTPGQKLYWSSITTTITTEDPNTSYPDDFFNIGVAITANQILINPFCSEKMIGLDERFVPIAGGSMTGPLNMDNTDINVYDDTNTLRAQILPNGDINGNDFAMNNMTANEVSATLLRSAGGTTSDPESVPNLSEFPFTHTISLTGAVTSGSPNGTVLQCFNYSLALSAAVSGLYTTTGIMYPTAFPNNCFSTMVQFVGTTPPANVVLASSPTDRSTFEITVNGTLPPGSNLGLVIWAFGN